MKRAHPHPRTHPPLRPAFIINIECHVRVKRKPGESNPFLGVSMKIVWHVSVKCKLDEYIFFLQAKQVHQSLKSICPANLFSKKNCLASVSLT